MSFIRGGLSESIPQSILVHLFAGKSLTAAGSSILFYDYTLTFSREVEYIWSAPWTSVKLLFLLNRYGNMIAQTLLSLEASGSLGGRTSRDFCLKMHSVGGCFLIISLESVRILVLKRAWAIWGCGPRVRICFISIYILYAMLLIGMAVYAEDDVQFRLLGILPMCLSTEPPYLWLIWLGPLAFDSAAFVIVWCSLRTLARGCCFKRSSPLLRLLVRDAAMFYIGSIFNNIFAIMCWTVYRGDARTLMGVTFSVPLNSIIGQRLVLNLRGLKTPHQLSTRELSREVDRQVAAMAHMLVTDVVMEGEGETDSGRARVGRHVRTRDAGVSRLEVELQDIRWSQSWGVSECGSGALDLSVSGVTSA